MAKNLVIVESPGKVKSLEKFLGKDYKVISVDGNTITIQLINGYEGDVIGNAIVNFQGETTTKRAPRKDNKSNSPKTGATMATGLALAGAGAAVLAAMKKKQDAE